MLWNRCIISYRMIEENLSNKQKSSRNLREVREKVISLWWGGDSGVENVIPDRGHYIYENPELGIYLSYQGIDVNVGNELYKIS